MRADLSRTLTVLADGEELTGWRYTGLAGQEALGLLPLPFTLELHNLPEESWLKLSRASNCSVLHGDSVLAWGTVSDAYRFLSKEGTVTKAVFSPGLPLWEAPVSLSVEAGVSVSETVRRLLNASGTGIPLLSFPGPDPVFSRGQAFFGRAAECVNDVLSAASCRACLVPSGLCVVPSAGQPVSLELSAADLLSDPAFPSGNRMVLRTPPTGWPVGAMLSVRWGSESAAGLIAGRSVAADTAAGPWQSELLIELREVTS